ncbi:hypothetical protein ACFY4I_13875 [Streptomyces scabiei]|uniref:hypothetical protein n=1 Tax=Streptomyces scabiei TaxID=1930 RepID=UPI00369B9899
MSSYLSSPDMSVGDAHSCVGTVRHAEVRSRSVAENSVLGHVLRRIRQENMHPDATYPAEFESSLPSETRM